MQKSKNHIAILDFGSQYTHLIARRVRELGMQSTIYSNNVFADELRQARGIILSGGPISVIGDKALDYDKKIFDLNIPILGICHGHQLIAKYFGGKVVSAQSCEYGIATIDRKESKIFQDVEQNTQVWMSHGDSVEKLPLNFKTIATSKSDHISAMENTEKNIFSFQYHPEVYHTSEGKKMLSNFVFNICRSEKNWNTDKILEQIKENILKQTKDKKVFLLVSGGVDSTVCYCLLEKYLGADRVYGLYVDHGFMRDNETNSVVEQLKMSGFNHLNTIDASKQFGDAIKGVSSPEKKRKIIGKLFLDVVNEEMQRKGFSNDEYLLGQGTIYPDVIESGGTKNAEVIKTHHNRVEIIQQMINESRVIEPISYLYKDEVRQIGKQLGLNEILINRHPFPGPGLAIRTLCSNEDLIDKVLDLNYSHKNYSLYKLPINSVGVQGDERTYANPALLVPKNNINWEELKEISPRITNNIKDINRIIVLMAGDKKKINNSVTRTAYLENRVEKLRKLDAIVNKHVMNNKCCRHVWQMPVILIPFGYHYGESLLVRPVESEEAMTVSFAKLPDKVINNIIKDVKKLDLVDYIFYDITNKPPGTIEWE